MEHQRGTPAADAAAIHDEHHRLQGEMPEQDIRTGEKIHLFQDMVVVEPPGKAFDAACRLRPSGHFRGDVGQLRALAAHDAAAERRQGVEVAGEVACRLRRRGWREGVADGLIAAKVVTHRPFLLFSIAGGGYDELTFKPSPAKNKIMSIDSIC